MARYKAKHLKKGYTLIDSFKENLLPKIQTKSGVISNYCSFLKHTMNEKTTGGDSKESIAIVTIYNKFDTKYIEAFTKLDTLTIINAKSIDGLDYNEWYLKILGLCEMYGQKLETIGDRIVVVVPPYVEFKSGLTKIYTPKKRS